MNINEKVIRSTDLEWLFSKNGGWNINKKMNTTRKQELDQKENGKKNCFGRMKGKTIY